MVRCVFIGDELSAAGYRLAGADCLTPAPDEVAAAFERSRAEAGLVMITAALACALPAERLAAALREQRPLTLVVPDIRGREKPADPTAVLKRQLGLSE